MAWEEWQAGTRTCNNYTYNWGPSKVLCKEHILLLLCARHLVCCWVVVAVGAMLQRDVCDAPRDVFTPANKPTRVTSPG